MKLSSSLLVPLLAFSLLAGCARTTPRNIYAMTITEFYELLRTEQRKITDVLSSDDHALFLKGRTVAPDSAAASRMTVGAAIEAGRQIDTKETAAPAKVPEATDR